MSRKLYFTKKLKNGNCDTSINKRGITHVNSDKEHLGVCGQNLDKNINKILRIFIKQEPVKLKNIRHNIFYLHLVCVHFFRNECTDVCKQRQRNIENDIKQLKRDLMLREEQYRQLEYENQVIRSFCFILCILICYLRVVLYTYVLNFFK